ncbi:MAG: UpxY family transcription antiterminator [Bacteroidota bacterium]
MAATAIAQKENHLHHTEARWFAIYTRYKCEKVVLQNLKNKGIECYVPLQEVKRQYTRKVKTHHIPLISCYAFVKVNKADYVRVLETDYVLEYVKIGRNLIAIPEQEIDLLKRIVGEGLVTAIEPSSVKVGDQVELIAGRLTGLKGKLVETNHGKRMVVQLETLGQDLIIEVSPELLRRVI